jgi:hypothetical protein
LSRWSNDETARSPDSERSPERTTRGDREPSASRDVPRADVRTLSEYRNASDRALDRDCTRHLQLPGRDTSDRVVSRDREYRLRGSEVRLIETIGQYRAVFVADLTRETSDLSGLEHDLKSLELQGLVDTRTITRLGEDDSAHVVALTDEGKSLLDDHRDPERDDGQRYYSGWVKPAELWHDAALYHMVRDVEIELERDGEVVGRVVLDDELKGRAYAELHRLRDDEGHSDDHAREIVSSLQDLHLEDGHFVFPDVRLEIRNGNGDVRTVDLELVTQHYHGAHLGGKASAGFRMFRAGSTGTRGGTPWSPGDYLT